MILWVKIPIAEILLFFSFNIRIWTSIRIDNVCFSLKAFYNFI
jgi:hypothetical protein